MLFGAADLRERTCCCSLRVSFLLFCFYPLRTGGGCFSDAGKRFPVTSGLFAFESPSRSAAVLFLAALPLNVVHVGTRLGQAHDNLVSAKPKGRSSDAVAPCTLTAAAKSNETLSHTPGRPPDTLVTYAATRCRVR